MAIICIHAIFSSFYQTSSYLTLSQLVRAIDEVPSPLLPSSRSDLKEPVIPVDQTATADVDVTPPLTFRDEIATIDDAEETPPRNNEEEEKEKIDSDETPSSQSIKEEKAATGVDVAPASETVKDEMSRRLMSFYSPNFKSISKTAPTVIASIAPVDR